MPYGLYISAEGAKAQARRLEVISNNLANVNTVGYKPDVATFQSRFAEAVQQGSVMPGARGQEDVGGGVKIDETLTNFAAGRLQHTGNASDMAIIGNGFFQVAGPGGQPMLTRAGNFRVDSQNQLVTVNGGHQVLDTGGAPIEINPETPWRVTRTGDIEQDGALTPIGLVQPDSLSELTKVGHNMFRARGSVAQVAEAQREIRTNVLEMSGVSPTTEMMSMIETSRAFEANARMIQNQDEMLSGLIGRVLRTA